MDNIIIVFILIIVVVIVWLRSRRKRGKQPIRLKPKSSKNNSQLKRQLLRMLGGDKAAAKRLIDREKIRNPGHTEAWYLEKIIYYLQRDNL